MKNKMKSLLIITLQIPHQRPPSSRERDRPVKPAYGKKHFSNTQNVSSSGAPKQQFGNYSQSYGTISSSGLANLQGKKW